MSILGRIRLLALGALLALVLPAATWAAPTCAVWLDQGDGTSWTTCVDDDGSQTCWRISNAAGSTAYPVACG
ncbi:MAG: hypothetical protein ACT4OK_20970 [Gemmobacter sp.]